MQIWRKCHVIEIITIIIFLPCRFWALLRHEWYLQMTIWAEISLYLPVNNTVLLKVQHDSKKTWL